MLGSFDRPAEPNHSLRRDTFNVSCRSCPARELRPLRGGVDIYYVRHASIRRLTYTALLLS